MMSMILMMSSSTSSSATETLAIGRDVRRRLHRRRVDVHLGRSSSSRRVVTRRRHRACGRDVGRGMGRRRDTLMSHDPSHTHESRLINVSLVQRPSRPSRRWIDGSRRFFVRTRRLARANDRRSERTDRHSLSRAFEGRRCLPSARRAFIRQTSSRDATCLLYTSPSPRDRG